MASKILWEDKRGTTLGVLEFPCQEWILEPFKPSLYILLQHIELEGRCQSTNVVLLYRVGETYGWYIKALFFSFLKCDPKRFQMQDLTELKFSLEEESKKSYNFWPNRALPNWLKHPLLQVIQSIIYKQHLLNKYVISLIETTKNKYVTCIEPTLIM